MKMSFLLSLAPLALAVFLTGCIESKPKAVSNKKIDLLATDTANSSTFAFNFAYIDTSTNVLYFQGIPNSGNVMISTCNAAGTGCQCEFLDTNSNVIAGTTATPTYDQTGNFYSCAYSGALGTLVYARLRNIASTKYSDKYTVIKTTLTARQLIGSSLDANKVRTVYRYPCQYNYLEKRGTGTTQNSFSCATSLSFCGPSGNFCLIEVKFPFWVYSDNYSSNMYKQMTDLIYNAGGTNVVCNRQIKQYDCDAGTTGELLTKYFGLYADSAGNFTEPVRLAASPTTTTEIYGYAAKVGSTGNCPPGMVKRDIYTATVAAVVDTSLAGTTATEINPTTVTPTAISVNRRYGDGADPNGGGTGGYCNDGVTCVAPRRDVGDTNKSLVATDNYTAANTPFCVIDPLILP